MRSFCLLLVTGVLLASGWPLRVEARATRPNLVFILADDLGWADTTLYGQTNFYRTPNLERLAKRGMTFTRAYTASPLCSPTRASILTGLSPARIGLTTPNCHLPNVVLEARPGSKAPAGSKSIGPESVSRLMTNYATLPRSLKAAGYATGHFGKWHLGPEPYSPLEHGFDVDIPHWPGPGPAGSYVAPWRFKDFDPDPGQPRQHIEDRMAREAVAFMEEHKDEPFFLNYWMFSVHAPFDAKKGLIEKYRDRIDPADPQRCPTYAAMIESMDDAVGTLLDALDRLGLAEKTILVFFSDNGGNMYDVVEGAPPTSNAPLRGGKATVYEGGLRVPCIVDWPGVVAPGTRSAAVVHSCDFYPTLLEALDLESMPGREFDGISIVPALKGEPLAREAIFSYFPHNPPVPDWLPPSVTVHRGDWKLIRLFHAGEDGAHRWKLFNLREDLAENHDLAQRQPERVKAMDLLIEDFLADTKAVVPIPNPAFDPAAYHPEQEGVGKDRSKPRTKNKPKQKPTARPKPKPKSKPQRPAEDLLRLGNGTTQIGIDRAMGASITWLSCSAYPKNMVNSSDPGRLIQQSYYAGRRLDRTKEGQSKAWSPWSWNPIQGGGVGSWARVRAFKRLDGPVLYGETIPKLWDMPDEEAEASMEQWTGFEPGMPNVVVVRNRLIAKRQVGDRWGPAAHSPQEVPACYFTRNFDQFKVYLGQGSWRAETQRPGPPWGRARPPRKAMACFNAGGQGIAIFSPTSGEHWNFGPHGGGSTDDPSAGPCVHVAPVSRVHLGPQSSYEYRYWLILGNEQQLAKDLDTLWKKYHTERGELIETATSP